MSRKIALKKLAQSDLNIFEYHLHHFKGGSQQKCINLNANPFIKSFYPNLKEIAEENDWAPFLVDLTILGPGNASQQKLSQKVNRSLGSKNWRLNGKHIPMPEGDDRYSVIVRHDYAILEFFGAAWPQKVTMTLIAANDPADQALHKIIDKRYPKFSMIALDKSDIESIYEEAQPFISADHPFRELLDSKDIEDAVQNGIDGIRSLNHKRSRGLSHEELRNAKKAFESIGHLGEEVLNQYLSEQVGVSIDSYQWVASENAIAPYDFEVVIDGAKQLIDAKSTGGPFTNPLHVSLAELREMAESDHPYRIYRLYEVKEDSAKVAISVPMATMAASILACVDDSLKENALTGVTVDSVSIRPNTIKWEQELTIENQDSDDTE